jgi:sarcosine dehydrogenase
MFLKGGQARNHCFLAVCDYLHCSRDLLQSLLNVDLSHESFAFSTHKRAQLAGHDLRILRLTFVGELGYELHIPAESCIPVYNAVMAEGQKYGIINSGYRAIDSLSIEKGFKHWHQDIRHDDTPLEGGLAFTCKLKTDTPFLGREAIERQKAEGLKKKLVCLTLDE